MARRFARRLALPSGLVVAARVIAATMAYEVVLTLSALVLYFAGLSIVPNPAEGTFGLVALGVAEAGALVAVLLFWRLVDLRPLVALGLQRDSATKRWFRGAAIGTLMMGFVVLAWYTLVDGASWDVNSDPGRATLALIGGLLGFLIQGPSEEILFRGYILENVRAEWGAAWAVGISAVGFGVFHGLNPGFGPLPLINLVLFGLGTALYKLRVDGSQLWGVFAIHTVWNWLQQVVFGLPNSGIASVPEYALFTVTPNTSLPAPVWGGGFGPEGTLAATVVLVALIVGSLRAGRRAESTTTTRRPAKALRR